METTNEKLIKSKRNILEKMRVLMTDPKVRAYAHLVNSLADIDNKLEEDDLKSYKDCKHEVVPIYDTEFRGHYYGCIKCGLTSYSYYLTNYSRLPFDELLRRIGSNENLHNLEKNVSKGKLICSHFYTKEEFEQSIKNVVKPFVKTSK